MRAFCSRPWYFRLPGMRTRQFHYFVIQQRTAQLQSNGHGGPVRLDQDVIGKIGVKVNVLQAAQIILRAALPIMLEETVHLTVFPYFPAKIWMQEAQIKIPGHKGPVGILR